MTTVAGIDCGTNSIRLLIATVDDEGRLVEVTRQMRTVRLGHGVDKTGRLDDAAISRTLAATREYRALCDENGVQSMRFVATSASRDASNADEFVSGVREIVGIEPEVVPGEVEAALSFAGVVHGLDAGEPPYLVVDLGGGSTEFVLGADEVQQAISVDMGCVRLTERYLHDDPPMSAQIGQAEAYVDELLTKVEAAVDISSTATLVGVAGTVTTVAAHALGLETYDRDAIHGCELPVGLVVESATALVAASRAERAAMGFMHPGRVDVIGAGSVVWRSIVRRVADRAGLEAVRVSEADILDGIALSQI